jgi:hypothetical protein
LAKGGLPHGLSFVEERFIGRKLLDGLPVLPTYRIDGVDAIGELVLGGVGKFLQKIVLESLDVLFRPSTGGTRQGQGDAKNPSQGDDVF